MMRARRLALALTLALVGVVPTPARAQAGPAQASAAGPASKRCNAMHAKVAREEKARNATSEAIAKELRGRETCTSKSQCARYDSALRSLDKRLAQQQARVDRFGGEVRSTCGTP
jgi:hypothetical protein